MQAPKFHKLCFQWSSCLIKGGWDPPWLPPSSYHGCKSPPVMRHDYLYIFWRFSIFKGSSIVLGCTITNKSQTIEKWFWAQKRKPSHYIEPYIVFRIDWLRTHLCIASIFQFCFLLHNLQYNTIRIHRCSECQVSLFLKLQKIITAFSVQLYCWFFVGTVESRWRCEVI